MSKRRYTNMVALLPAIESMLAAGMSHREIENEANPALLPDLFIWA